MSVSVPTSGPSSSLRLIVAPSSGTPRVSRITPETRTPFRRVRSSVRSALPRLTSFASTQVRLRSQNSLIRSLSGGASTWTVYVCGRVVTVYEPSPAVGRQIRPVGNRVSTHTKAPQTGAPSVVVTLPRSWGPGCRSTSICRSPSIAMSVVSTPSSTSSYHWATSRTLSGGTVHMKYLPGSMSARYAPFLLVRTQSQGSGAASVLVQTCASSIGPLGPRTTPLSRTPLSIVIPMLSTSAERASIRSAEPLDSRPVAHCAISLPPGGPVTSSLYTSDRTSIENFPSPAVRAHVGDASGSGGCAQTSASTTAAPRSSLMLPLILECGSSCTTLVASASSTSAHVRPSARRVGACGVTRTEYVPGRSPSRAVPDALVSPQRSWA